MAYPRTVARKAAPNATAGDNQLEIIPAAKYLKANDIVGMDAVVSENTNGYPYVGFTSKAGVRENIYFSKNLALQRLRMQTERKELKCSLVKKLWTLPEF